MLNKVVMITVLDNKGHTVDATELTEIAFNKDGSMGMLPSKVFLAGMREVEKGGAIFIEKIWST